MGKPGGFFKRLKAKQSREASKQHRGTKGASKDERRRKHNEKVEYYAAKREADELAAVSSSSDSEASSDPEVEQRKEERSLRKLRTLLGVHGGDSSANSLKRRRSGRNGVEEEEDSDSIRSSVGDSDGAANAARAAVDRMIEADPEDWKAYLGDGEDSDSASAASDDDDDDDDDGFLIDCEDDDDGEDGGVMNPLFDADEGDFDDGADLFDQVEIVGPAEDDEEEEAYYDENASDDSEAATAPKPKAALMATEAERKLLLPRFVLGTSGLSTLKQSAAVVDGDPWLAKYHLDQHGDVDRSAMTTIPLSAAAVEALTHSNDVLIEKATEDEATIDKRERGIFFVGPSDYASVRPENVTVAATAHARANVLHPLFTPPGRSGTAALASKPSYMNDTLWGRWIAFRAEARKPVFTVEERGLLNLLQGYPDVMDCLRCWQNAESRREIYVLHMLNHWFKARSVVVAHDAIISANRRKRQKHKQTRKGRGARKSARVEGDEEEDEHDKVDSDDFELRDRGFGKTRLFVMLPMRNIAYQYVGTLVKLLGADPGRCPKLATFEQDFTEMEEAADPTFHRRPRDYQRQFDGNIDDSFCVGLRLELSRVHVYAHPLNSDIILCSPLGLRRRLAKSGDVLVSLSSVEVCVVDEAHVLLEQNWQHVAAVLALLNKRPTETTFGLSDLRRVYAWALDGKSGRHRQTVFSSNISNATLLSTFRSFLNNSGKVVLQHQVEEGVLPRVAIPVRQHFTRFEAESIESVDNDRFAYFTKEVYASKLNPLAERDVRVIVVVPSYFDFVRLRNFMYREYRDTYACISEYTTIKQQRKALGQFSDLERPVLLVTERFYFFKRYFVKLAEVMVFYSPPLFPEFYCSLVNRIVAASPNAFTLTVFCQYDTHELNRIVGTKRMRQLLERGSSVFSFTTSQ